MGPNNPFFCHFTGSINDHDTSGHSSQLPTIQQPNSTTASSCSRASSPEGTWSKQPPAVVAVCGALAVVAEALALVVAGLPVHHKALPGALLRQACAVLGKVALPGRAPAHAGHLFEL